MPPRRKARFRLRIRLSAFWKRRWVRLVALGSTVPLVVLCFAAAYYYVTFGHLIDSRLSGERERVFPRIFARPLELRQGQLLTDQQLIDRLNDLGYTERARLERPGEFMVDRRFVAIQPRSPDLAGQTVRVMFQRPVPAAQLATRRPPRRSDHIERLEVGNEVSRHVMLDAPLLSSVVPQREKRRPVALSALPPHVVQAVLAIEDRRFYYHPGVDPIRMAGALVDSMRGGNRVSATSTITQQLARNVFLPQFEGWTLQTARERSIKRKLLEGWVSVVLTRRATKDEILEMYLNEVPLGNRGSFAIFGVSEAARLFFGKDVTNLSLAEAATIAGVIQSPSALSPFTNSDRCRERRNVVLHAMVDAGFVTEKAAAVALAQPLSIVQRALEAEAPYFVDYVGQELGGVYPGLTTNASNQAVDVYTTLDLHLQRLANDAVRSGLTRVDEQLARRKRKGRAEAALIAVDPRTGEILAMVGGRSYNQSQFNRAVTARRQPGSVFKPFVYLAAFETAARDGRTDMTPATIVDDEPETWEFQGQEWTPENFEEEYDGPITYRHALAHSRNLATIKVAEATGFDRVAALWKKLGVATVPKPYPSIALGVFEATPFEIATAYTLFPNLGILRPLRSILEVTSGKKDVTQSVGGSKRITRSETAFLVTSMMRSVLNEGTGAGARAQGFTLDAAGKTGTTNDLRDAWFVGFTPELLTVVWVGFDDNQPLGLSGAQAALPIWTQFMTRALAGYASSSFAVPDGISFVDIDPDTGQLAQPGCPTVIHEAFLAGTEPTEVCELHRAR